MLKIKSLVIVCFVIIASGCVSPIPLKEQVPSVSYKTNDKVIVAVIDNRKRVIAGKSKTYIGKAHGSFGIPFDWNIGVISTEAGDKNRTLAEFLEYRIVAGLQNDGWNVKSGALSSKPTEEEAIAVLKRHNVTKLVLLDLKEWYFSINLNWVSAFNFDTDSAVSVYEIENGQIEEKTIAGRDVIDETSSESPQNNILRAYRDQLSEILNDDAVKQALSDIK